MGAASGGRSEFHTANDHHCKPRAGVGGRYSKRNGGQFLQKIFLGTAAFRPQLLLERQSVPRKWAASQAHRLVDSCPRIITLPAGLRACRRSIALLLLSACHRPPGGTGASPMGCCWQWPLRPGSGSCLGFGIAPRRSRASRWRCRSWRGLAWGSTGSWGGSGGEWGSSRWRFSASRPSSGSPARAHRRSPDSSSGWSSRLAGRGIISSSGESP